MGYAEFCFKSIWNKMKNLFKTMLFTLSLAATMPIMANVTNEPVKEMSAADRARAEQIIKRLEEIKAMDTKSMSSPEKRQLRKEVRAAKKELNEAATGGVYISVGALIIIILLLILIL